jgi:hypothetical protein
VTLFLMRNKIVSVFNESVSSISTYYMITYFCHIKGRRGAE